MLQIGLAILAIIVAGYWTSMFFSSQKLETQGKHACIPGGSQGLGLSVACKLAARGAHVSIIARTQSKLDAAVKTISQYTISPKQRICSASADLSSLKETARAFDEVEKQIGRPADIMIACMGGAGPSMGMFNDLTEEQLRSGMDTNFFTTLWSAKEASRRMIANKIKGRIVLVGSVLSFFTLPGYGTYPMAKQAVRALVDQLRSEMLMYGITVQAFFPATILSPGFENEQQTKPELTKEIEGVDEGQTPDQAANTLLSGIDAGKVFITNDAFGTLLKNRMQGGTPHDNIFVDFFWRVLGSIIMPPARYIIERKIKAYGRSKGYTPP